jgi:hypothetical protein
MKGLILRLGLLSLVVWSAQLRSEEEVSSFDLVLANGRVMDPESGFDDTRHLGIRNGKIAVISEAPLNEKEVLDVRV